MRERLDTNTKEGKIEEENEGSERRPIGGERKEGLKRSPSVILGNRSEGGAEGGAAGGIWQDQGGSRQQR